MFNTDNLLAGSVALKCFLNDEKQQLWSIRPWSVVTDSSFVVSGHAITTPAVGAQWEIFVSQTIPFHLDRQISKKKSNLQKYKFPRVLL